LTALPAEDVELRARLLARLAGSLRDEPTRDRRDALSREAVELGRRAGDQAVLAYALDGRASAIVAPDTIRERLAIAGELREVAERIGDTERIMQGHTHRQLALLQLGDVPGAEAELDAALRIARELRQPVQLWQARGVQAMLALAAGRLDEAEQLIPEALALGEHAHPAAVIPVYRMQLYTLCEFRGTLDSVEPEIRDLAAEFPTRPVFRCVLAHLNARLGRRPEARRALEALADREFSALPFDQEWLFGMSLLAEVSALLADTDSASVLYRMLLPWAALNAVDQAEGVRGAVSRYLGLLATTTGRWQEAETHFEAALAMNTRMGARPWLAYTQRDYAGMLRARGSRGDRGRADALLDEALASFRELGLASGAPLIPAP
jgi:tetratricopeptide (TPR) repeat protein